MTNTDGGNRRAIRPPWRLLNRQERHSRRALDGCKCKHYGDALLFCVLRVFLVARTRHPGAAARTRHLSAAATRDRASPTHRHDTARPSRSRRARARCAIHWKIAFKSHGSTTSRGCGRSNVKSRRRRTVKIARCGTASRESSASARNRRGNRARWSEWR